MGVRGLAGACFRPFGTFPVGKAAAPPCCRGGVSDHRQLHPTALTGGKLSLEGFSIERPEDNASATGGLRRVVTVDEEARAPEGFRPFEGFKPKRETRRRKSCNRINCPSAARHRANITNVFMLRVPKTFCTGISRPVLNEIRAD